MLTTGAVLKDRYRIDALVGKGGMAEVYGATDLRMDARVAVKRMLLDSADAGAQELIAQFRREAGILRSLHHVSVPSVYDWFEDDRHHYLVMDFVEGHTLDTLLDPSAEAAHPYQVVAWGLQVVRALVYLHANQVIHKDIKPQNLILTDDGTIVLVDFGIARAPDAQGRSHTLLHATTPGYGAPELHSGVRSDARADLYGLGATLYALLSRQTPPDSVSRLESLQAGRGDPLVTLCQLNAEVSPVLESVVHRLMQVDREQRYPTALAAQEALEQAAPPAPPQEESASPSATHADALAQQSSAPPPIWSPVASGGSRLPPSGAATPLADRGPSSAARPSSTHESARASSQKMSVRAKGLADTGVRHSSGGAAGKVAAVVIILLVAAAIWMFVPWDGQKKTSSASPHPSAAASKATAAAVKDDVPTPTPTMFVP